MGGVGNVLCNRPQADLGQNLVPDFLRSLQVTGGRKQSAWPRGGH
jgi:hypothetical protein